MYLKLPIGFDFSSYKSTKQIIDNEVVKYVKTWQGQRIYDQSFGIDWQNFDYTRTNNQDSMSGSLMDFLGNRLTQGMPQITMINIIMDTTNNSFNNFSFYLVYNYKGLMQSKVFIRMNLDGQVSVNLNTGSFSNGQ